MIYEETYRHLLHNVSSTEFDTCLFSLLHMDWDGVIQLSLHQMALGIGTTKKYLQHLLNKCSEIFIPVESEGKKKYQFKLGKIGHLDFNAKTDRYCKKYSFFYSKAFRCLPIHAKRLLLMAAYKMSLLKTESVMFPYDDILSVLTKKQHVTDAMEVIETTMAETVSIQLTKDTKSHKDVLLFSFLEGTLGNYTENFTERHVLRRKIFEEGFLGHIPDRVCIELERVGKHLFRSFITYAEKMNAMMETKEQLIKLVRYIYTYAKGTLSKALHSNPQLLTDPKQASAYFSTIIYNETLVEMAKYSNQATMIKTLLDREDFHREISEEACGRTVDFLEVEQHLSPIRNKHAQVELIQRVLNQWCEDWIIARVKSVTDRIESGKNLSKSGQPVSEYLVDLLKKTHAQLENLIGLIRRFSLHFETIHFLKEKKQAIQDYFSIQKDLLLK